MWKDKLQEIIQEKKIYGEKVNIGATEEEIEIFFKEAKAELNVDLPNDYANILELVNNPEKLSDIQKAASKLAKFDGVQKIVEQINS